MSGILPKFVTPSDVRDLKNRLDPFVRALDATVAKCPSLDPGVGSAFSDFSKAWRTYFEEDDSWLHSAAQYDTGESYEKSIAEWQQTIGASCPLPGPKVEPPTAPVAVSGELQHTVRTVAIAGVVIAACITLRSVVR
jgi:hypothetical protein